MNSDVKQTVMKSLLVVSKVRCNELSVNWWKVRLCF